MSLSITSSSATLSTAANTNLNSIALTQKQASTSKGMAAAPLTVTALAPLDHTRLDKYLQALGAPLAMGADAQNIANALTLSMKSIVSERPDLANAHFDFQSSNGSIQVVSQALSASDKNWIQGKLNDNSNLVQAVESFHDDVVAGYATWSEADGSPLTQAQSDAVSKKADGLVSFLSLFQSLGNDAARHQMKDGAYKRSDGATMNLAQDPTTAAGFLEFNKSAQASTNGTFSFTSNSGHTLHGSQLNIFDNDSVMPNFFPPSQTKSLGFNEVA